MLLPNRQDVLLDTIRGGVCGWGGARLQTQLLLLELRRLGGIFDLTKHLQLEPFDEIDPLL